MGRDMGSGGRSFKTVFGVLALVGFMCFLLVGIGILESGETKTRTTLMYSQTAGSLNDMKVVEGEKIDVHPETDLNYMNKRRVPNGPDPIHNRRAGNSGRPPRQG